MRSDFNYWITIPTRFQDLDPHNHVNNVVYFVYFETARLAFLRSIQLENIRERGKFGPAVKSQTCNYQKQVFHPSVLEVGIRFSNLTNRTFTVSYEVYLEETDTLVCDGATIMVWVDFIKEQSIPIPAELRDAIGKQEGQPV
jgi:acyl-CoA thioester hydrolase